MLTRRKVLGAGATMIAGWLWTGVTMKLRPVRKGSKPSGLRSPTVDRHVVLGRAYLQNYPDEASQSRLARLVPSDPFLRTFQVRSDFAEGQVVTLRGWVLSRTECRYCALQAMASTGARMIINLDQQDVGKAIECDLCIAGSGAAGLSIALQFIDQRYHKIIVLEGGGREFSETSQEIYQGRNLGINYADLDVTRLRYFGGTTNHWGGWCRPLDPMDFEVRSWLPHSGWADRPKRHRSLQIGSTQDS